MSHWQVVDGVCTLPVGKCRVEVVRQDGRHVARLRWVQETLAVAYGDTRREAVEGLQKVVSVISQVSGAVAWAEMPPESDVWTRKVDGTMVAASPEDRWSVAIMPVRRKNGRRWVAVVNDQMGCRESRESKSSQDAAQALLSGDVLVYGGAPVMDNDEWRRHMAPGLRAALEEVAE